MRITEGKKGCTFGVHVVPRSHRDGVVGLYGEALKVRLKAPPVGGKANQALRAFLAERLGVPTEAVEIISGHTSRHKVVRVAGVVAEDVRALLDENREERGG
ncbi:MAG TPA: YggU family protein [Chloroflexi bacterium]|nr:YggU family protein [Chloroflexota bacterium]